MSSRFGEWWRQAECIEIAGLASTGAMLRHAGERAAAAQSWADWMAAAGQSLQEALDDVARIQGEWLSAWLQCEMEITQMCLDAGPSSLLRPAPGLPLTARWFVPWLPGPGARPVAVA